MTEIKVNLDKQVYPVFNLENHTELVLQNKNFIFGKNGSGKSTITNLILEQYQNEYDIRVFTGLESVLIDDKLNAVVLGEENTTIKKEIQRIDNEISKLLEKLQPLLSEYQKLDWKVEYSENNIPKHDLLQKKEEAQREYNEKSNQIDTFFQDSARELKQMKNPQITDTSYNKNTFFVDIKDAEVLSPEEFQQSIDILREQSKEEYKRNSIDETNLKEMLNEANNLIQSPLKEIIVLDELANNNEKKAFAQHGKEIHEINDQCAFCGNLYTKERSDVLTSYFEASVILEYQEKLQKFRKKIETIIRKYENIEMLKEASFYVPFIEKVNDYNKLLKDKQLEVLYFLNTLLDEVNARQMNNFEIRAPILFAVPDNFKNENILIDEIILENNSYTQKLESEQTNNRKKLRLHYVFNLLNKKKSDQKKWLGYEFERMENDRLKNEFEKAKKNLDIEITKILGTSNETETESINYLEKKITEYERNKVSLLEQTRNTSKLANNINIKLKKSGKENLQLELQKDNDEVEHYLVKDEFDGVRSIDKVSTGEKNIIAFLYFMENLSSIKEDKSKIIIFDDPMNSNDDTMQYLIITEMQKLYQEKYREKFKANRDIFICLTHNAHFYLNVQPHGYFKEKKPDPNNQGKFIEVSKYTKNNFYWLLEGIFKKITSETEDLNTHYEYLWMELETLYQNNLINSMLNSMRRIIETYTKFNKINVQKFYLGNEEEQKLFNVNSHSIDDLSAELVGKTREQLLESFKKIFFDNSAEEHFNSHWKLKEN